MSFSRSLLSSSVLAGTVFCAATAPLATLESDAVTVQFGDNPIFVGQVKDAAVPYLGLAMAISLGAGAVHLSSLGWRQSSAKLSETQDEVARLKQQLQEQVSRVNAVQFSDQKLETAGLETFLDPVKPQATQPTPHGSGRVAAQTSRPNGLSPSHAQPLAPVASAAASSMPAAQAFRGFSAAPPAAPTGNALSVTAQAGQSAQVQPLDDLMSQLKHVMAQVEKLQDQGINAHAHIA